MSAATPDTGLFALERAADATARVLADVQHSVAAEALSPADRALVEDDLFAALVPLVAAAGPVIGRRLAEMAQSDPSAPPPRHVVPLRGRTAPIAAGLPIATLEGAVDDTARMLRDLIRREAAAATSRAVTPAEVDAVMQDAARALAPIVTAASASLRARIAALHFDPPPPAAAVLPFPRPPA